MIDRSRLAVSGALLAVVAFAIHALLAWTDYQRDLDAYQNDNFEWVPNYWNHLQGGLGLATMFLMAFGVAMVVVAWTMRPAESADDAIFRPPT